MCFACYGVEFLHFCPLFLQPLGVPPPSKVSVFPCLYVDYSKAPKSSYVASFLYVDPLAYCTHIRPVGKRFEFVLVREPLPLHTNGEPFRPFGAIPIRRQR